MKQRAIFAIIFVTLSHARVVKLSSSETVVEVEAGASAPQFSSVVLDGGKPWVNQAPQGLIDHVDVNGATLPVTWHFRPTESTIGSSLVKLVYQSDNPRLRLIWEWQVRAAHGPIEHRIEIDNLSTTEFWLPLQDALQFSFRLPTPETAKAFWVEKGASSPSSQGLHLFPLLEGTNWTGTSSTYAHPSKSQPREMIPYLLVQRSDESGWYIGIEFSGRTRISIRRHGSSLEGVVGLNPEPGPYRTRLPAGGSYETPTIFLGAFRGGPDGAGNILRRWIREVLNNPSTIQSPQYPMLVSNSWGSGMAISEQQAKGMIRDASGLGLEMFHLDAGWFQALGDWVSDEEKFPHGVTSVADDAHQLGLKFGLWTDWTQAGISDKEGALNARDPKVHDWLTTDVSPGWKPAEFKGITIDIGVPAAREWAKARVTQIVQDFHLDMLEHDGYLVAQGCERRDHAHAVLDEATARRFRDEDFQWVSGSNDTDVSDHAARAYYDVQSSLRSRFPALLLEVCNDGGRMVDFGSAAHGDYFSITDAYNPVDNRKAFFDASYVLPPAMLETYVEKWQADGINNFRYMLRSGMMGWFSLMQDSNAWTKEQHEAAKQEFALYKLKLRPLIRNADLYHVSQRPDGAHWDGIEYFDPNAAHGVLFAFRGSLEGDNQHTFKLRGLQMHKRYKLTFQGNSSSNYIAAGEELLRRGVTVRALQTNTSELVFIEETRAMRLQ